MFRKTMLSIGIAAAVLTGVTPTMASARGWGDRGGWHESDRGEWRGQRHDRDWRGDRDDWRRYGYGDRDDYYRGRGYDRPVRYRCHDNGTGGLIIGAIAGGLLGNEIARDGTAGTIIGGGAGALLGRAIDRGNC